jgi:transposase-like protein
VLIREVTARAAEAAAYIFRRVDSESPRHVAGVWIETDQSAMFWLNVSELRAHGVEDVPVSHAAIARTPWLLLSQDCP